MTLKKPERTATRGSFGLKAEIRGGITGVGKGKKRGVATNSIILAFVQCLTMVTGILQTMILSRVLTEAEYGTYSQGMLVVNFIVPFLLLGMANAITFFSGQNNIDRRKYVCTIFTMIIFTGGVGAIGILCGSKLIQGYFGNPLLAGILPFAAWLPLLLNLISAFQTLFIAEDMATSIAIRNAVVAVVQVGIIAVSVFYFHEVRIIFLLLLVMDTVQIIAFSQVFARRKYRVRPMLITQEIAGRIFGYSIPLALSTAIGTLSIYMDKLLIGRMMSVEDFALYSNMSKELPFAFIISSITTVIMPAFIRMHANGEDEKLKVYWSKYLELGIRITWVMCGTAIFCAKDLLVFLYSEKYLRGIAVFIVYLTVDMCRFSYCGMILSTFGKTKVIMISSLLSLICNFVLNFVLFHLMGMIGPAIASLISIVLMQMLQIIKSCSLLKCRVLHVFNIKSIIILIAEIVVVGTLVSMLGSRLNVKPILRLILCGGCIAGTLLMINYRRLISLIKDINAL